MQNLESIICNDIVNNNSDKQSVKSSLIVKLLTICSSWFPPESKLKEEYKNKKITHYARATIDYTIGVLVKAQIGAFPGKILDNTTLELKKKYNISESPQKYTAYSIGIGLLNNALFFLASYGLIKMPNISLVPFADEMAHTLGYAKLGLVIYSTFIEIPVRTYFLIVKKKAIGILPFEGLYRLFSKKQNR